MYENNKTIGIRQTSYTWKEEYSLPFESNWSRIAKFSFLNGMSWGCAANNSILRKYMYATQLKPFYSYIPPFYLEKNIEYNEQNMLCEKYGVSKMCPACMKYAYHSVLHEIEGLNYCVFHRCNLVQIDCEKFYESRYGTYEFYDVKIKTENIIKCDRLLSEIQKFIYKQENIKFISSNFISINSNSRNKIDKCYESTERLYQNLLLFQNEIDLYGCKRIDSIAVRDIQHLNEELIEHIIDQHIKNYEEKNQYNNPEESSRDEIKTFFKTNFIQKGKNGENILKNELFGWCFIGVASEAIRGYFDSIKDWNIYFENMYNDTKIYLKDIQEVRKVAVILAYQVITGVASPEKIHQNQSKYWKKECKLSSFSLPVYEKLGNFEQTWAFYKGSYTQAGQYILYPIIKNLFLNLFFQAMDIIKENGYIVDKNFLCSIKPDTWIIPQYVVIYYNDKVDIYACEAEYGE